MNKKYFIVGLFLSMLLVSSINSNQVFSQSKMKNISKNVKKIKEAKIRSKSVDEIIRKQKATPGIREKIDISKGNDVMYKQKISTTSTEPYSWTEQKSKNLGPVFIKQYSAELMKALPTVHSFDKSISLIAKDKFSEASLIELSSFIETLNNIYNNSGGGFNRDPNWEFFYRDWKRQHNRGLADFWIDNDKIKDKYKGRYWNKPKHNWIDTLSRIQNLKMYKPRIKPLDYDLHTQVQKNLSFLTNNNELGLLPSELLLILEKIQYQRDSINKSELMKIQMLNTKVKNEEE